MDEYFDYVSLLIPGFFSANTNSIQLYTWNYAPYFLHPFNVSDYYFSTDLKFSTTSPKYYSANVYDGTDIASAAMYFEPTTAYGTDSPEDVLFQFHEESWTIEGWWRGISANRPLFQTGDRASDTARIGVYRNTSNLVFLAVYDGSVSTPAYTTTGYAFSANVDHHIAVSYDYVAGNIYFYVDFNLVDTISHSWSNIHAYGLMFHAGGYATSTTQLYSRAYSTDFRVTKGICRYNATTAPTGAQLMGTISGTVTDYQGNPTKALVMATPHIGKPRVTSGVINSLTTIETDLTLVDERKPLNTFCTISDATTGAYTLNLPKAEWSLSFLECDSTTLLNDIVHRVIAE